MCALLYGYWCPGAKTPSHQYPQCWLNICYIYVYLCWTAEMLHLSSTVINNKKISVMKLTWSCLSFKAQTWLLNSWLVLWIMYGKFCRWNGHKMSVILMLLTSSCSINIFMCLTFVNHIVMLYCVEISLTHWGRGKWTPFRRRHFQMHFLEWKCLNSD